MMKTSEDNNEMSLPIKLQIPSDFLNEEHRDGFKVTANIKKIWAVELDLLSEFFKACKRNNIQAYAAYGTLLGAVRHKGFIPWDDDADVYMDRQNFKKLLKIGAKEFKHPYFLQTAYSDRTFFCPYARLRNSLTTGIISGHETPEYNNGIYIDIFVLDAYTKSKIASWIQKKMTDTIEVLFFQGYTEKKLYKTLSAIAKRCIPYQIAVDAHAFILGFFNHSTRTISLLTDKSECRENIVQRSDLLGGTELPFENIKLPAPKSYDKILSLLYGDYMKFPPIEERGKWHEGQLKCFPEIPYKDYFKAQGMSSE